MTNAQRIGHPDTDGITTPSELRRAVLLALDERATLGDQLATGAARVIRHLEAQANRLVYAASAAAYEDYRKTDIDYDCDRQLVRR